MNDRNSIKKWEKSPFLERIKQHEAQNSCFSMRPPLPKRSLLLLPPVAKNKQIWQWRENLGTGKWGEGMFVPPQPLWTYAAWIQRGRAARRVIVETCFRLTWFLCQKKKHNNLSHKPGPNSLYKTPFYSHHHQTPDWYKFLNRHMFWVNNILPLWTSGLGDLSTYCVMASLWTSLCCYFEVTLKSKWQNGGGHSARFREQLDFVILAFRQLLLCHFSTQLFWEMLKEIVCET